MRRQMFNAKIHRATLTHADLHYEGSITIDGDLMKASGILQHEQVHVWNVTQGTRLVTYALEGPAGSGVLCLNGAAAHGNAVGDLMIVATFVDLDDAEARAHVPTVVLVDQHNRVAEIRQEIPGPQLPPQVVHAA
ncbi:MAG: aspartate 1-decarboxylase [Myxococcota bacterium]